MFVELFILLLGTRVRSIQYQTGVIFLQGEIGEREEEMGRHGKGMSMMPRAYLSIYWLVPMKQAK